MAARTHRGTRASSHLEFSIPPISMAPAHPNSLRIFVVSCFAYASLPQISISASLDLGWYICEFGTALKLFTTLASGSLRWIRSPKESYNGRVALAACPLKNQEGLLRQLRPCQRIFQVRRYRLLFDRISESRDENHLTVRGYITERPS